MPSARLPISGTVIELAPPAGADDLLLLEATDLDLRTALALIAGTVRIIEPHECSVEQLPLGDLDTALLLVRRLVFGDVIRTEVGCPASDCRARLEIAFGIDDYVDHHRPRTPRGIAGPKPGPGTAGWFTVVATDTRFRIPTAADLLAATAADDPVRELRQRCLHPFDGPAAVRRRAERALDALAPTLAGELTGACHECGTAVIVSFDPLPFCLLELRAQAVTVVDDIHLIASTYHWAEGDVLSLPRHRRLRYAELIRDERQAWLDG